MTRGGRIHAIGIYKRGEPISGALPSLHLWKIMQTPALFTSFDPSIFVAQPCNYPPFFPSHILPAAFCLFCVVLREEVAFFTLFTVFSCLFTTIRLKRRVLLAP
ncbi:hypothetical protein CCMA1212_008116 [Trichoderma ghanense]|uniref:Uncharacterized protein n=1 Tax=Trichoderma ghanense TaxID=65468 RepID=A0ABY2GXQ3_9HYPO